MTTIEQGLDILADVLKVSASYFPDESRAAQAIANVVSERAQIDGEHAVVAFVGATGAGKSSLINALVRQEVTHVAPTRPATTRAIAVSETAASSLLDWLGVQERHVVPGALGSKELVLIDLPDIDSVELAHQETAERFVERADAVVVVLDPQKYADALVHDYFLKKMSQHSGTTLIILNQADRIRPEDREAVTADVLELVHADGLECEVILTSALTGEGIPALHRRVLTLVEKRQAVRLQMAARLRSIGDLMTEANTREGGSEPVHGHESFDAVAAAIAQAVGSDVVAKAAADSYAKRCVRRASSLFGGWRNHNDPLEDLGLLNGRYVPRESRIADAEATVRAYAASVLAELPEEWRRVETEKAANHTSELVLDAAKVLPAVDLRGRTPMWWLLASVVSTVAMSACAVGVLWMLALTGVVGVRLPEPAYIGGVVSFPLALVAAGAGIWLVANRLVAWARSMGARRCGKRVARQFVEACSARSSELVRDPLARANAAYADFYADLKKLHEVS